MDTTLTYDAIVAELKDVPSNKLEELYNYVHSLASSVTPAKDNKERIMSYFGMLRNMPADSPSETFL